MGWIKRRDINKRADRETAIALAMKAVQHDKLSIRAAAEAHNLAFSTLRDQLKGAVAKPKAHREQQLLSPQDEKAMLRLIDSLERTGFPPRIEHVKQAAERINIHGRPPGKNWITRFLCYSLDQTTQTLVKRTPEPRREGKDH